MYFGPGISVGKRGVSYGDSDAQAFIAATGITGTTEVSAINKLVANLKTYGLWSKMKAIYPFVSDTYNLLSYTEDFGNAAWQKINSLTVATNTAIAPNGTLTADTLINATGNPSVARQQITTAVGQTLTFSVWVKCASGTVDSRIRIEENGGSYPSTFANITVTTEWQRVSVTRTLTSAIITSSMCDIFPDIVTQTNKQIYVWGAQTELSASATTYQPIATTPANRFVSQFKYNLKDPRDIDAAFRLAFSGTWAYSQQGALPNGANAYADTFLVPNTVLGQNSKHLSSYARTTINNTLLGAGDTNISNDDQLIYLPTSLYGNLSSIPMSIVHTGSTGLYAVSRTASTTAKSFRNGTLLGSDNQTSTGNTTRKIYLGVRNLATPDFYSTTQQAFATIGDGLTDTEASNLYTSVQIFNQDLSRQVGVPIVSDSDAQSFLNAAVITDTTQANAINTLVVGLKNASLWTKMKAIYPFVGGTATTHKWNLKDPRDLDAAYRLAFSGAWTHSSTGALPNGTNAFADTYLNQSANLNASSVHLSYYSRTNSTVNAFDMAGNSGAPNYYGTQLACYYTGIGAISHLSSYPTESAVSTSFTNTQAYYIGSRTNNTTNKIIRNGSVLATNSNTRTATLPSLTIKLCWDGAISYTNRQAAFSTIGDGLNDSEASSLYTLVQAFQTTLGRQV